MNKLKDRYGEGGGNIAIASGTINGSEIQPIQSFSGKSYLAGYAKLPPDAQRQLKSETLNRLDRKIDAESKILETILLTTKAGDIGTIKIFSERFVCSSCGGMIAEFKEMRKHINIEISSIR